MKAFILNVNYLGLSAPRKKQALELKTLNILANSLQLYTYAAISAKALV